MSNVEHPKHYQAKIEPIEFIHIWDLNFNLGNVIKYVCRAGKKDKSKTIEDLEKSLKDEDFEDFEEFKENEINNDSVNMFL